MSLLRCDIQNTVAMVSLNRPDQRNALSSELMTELTRCFEELEKNQKVRVVVLKGQGKVFCAGADIAEMKNSVNLSDDENTQGIAVLEALLNAAGNFSKPLVAQVHGAAIGGGLGLVACCDVVVASAETVYALSEVRLGILPAVIMPYVARKLGFSQTSRYMLSGERFDSLKAKEIHLVHEVLDSVDELDSATATIVSELLKGATGAQQESKRLLRRLNTHEFEEHRQLTQNLIAGVRRGDEAQEGLKAFLEKRSPSWMPEE